MSDNEMNMDMDSLLDATLDDLQDLPEFKPYSPGAHQVLATFDKKEINGKAAIELGFKLVETLELTNPSADEMQEPGAVANTMFMLDNEFGQGNLKRLSAPFAEAMGLATLRDVVEQVKDIECVIVTSIRTDKKDPNDIKHYLNVKELNVVGAAAPVGEGEPAAA